MALLWTVLNDDPGKDATEAPVAQAPEPASGPDRSGPRAPGCRFEKGQRLAYTMDVTTRVKVQPGRLNLPPGAQLEGLAPDRATQAHLDLKVLSADASGAGVLLARYGYVDPRTVAEAGALDGPFLLKVSARCKIEGYARLDTTGTGLGPHPAGPGPRAAVVLAGERQGGRRGRDRLRPLPGELHRRTARPSIAPSRPTARSGARPATWASRWRRPPPASRRSAP